MKKLLLSFMIALFVIVGFCNTGFSATPCTQKLAFTDNARELTIVCTADGAHLFSNTAISAENLQLLLDNWFVYHVQVIPGVTTTTAGTKVTFLDGNSFDLLQGMINDVSTKAEYFIASSGIKLVPFSGFTITMTNNLVNNASFTLIVRFSR